MAWKPGGAVERGVTIRQHKDLAEGAGDRGALKRKGYFEQRPHLAVGPVVCVAWSLLLIYLATQFAQLEPRPFRCHPGDHTTTNGRDLCPPHEVRR